MPSLPALDPMEVRLTSARARLAKRVAGPDEGTWLYADGTYGPPTSKLAEDGLYEYEDE